MLDVEFPHKIIPQITYNGKYVRKVYHS